MVVAQLVASALNAATLAIICPRTKDVVPSNKNDKEKRVIVIVSSMTHLLNSTTRLYHQKSIRIHTLGGVPMPEGILRMFLLPHPCLQVLRSATAVQKV